MTTPATQSAPRVSVVIPAYNRAQLLPRALNSVLRQTFGDFEAIVVDDASEDDTRSVVEDIGRAAPRVKYIRHKTNRGGAAARNTGIDAASGDFIAFLDSDDEWLPTKLERQVARFDSNDADLGFVFCVVASTDTAYMIEEDFVPERIFRGDIRDEVAYGIPAGCHLIGLMVRAELIRSVGGFDDALPSAQDWDIILRLALAAECDMVDEILAVYHNQHEHGRITANLDSLIRGREEMLDKHRDFLSDYPAARFSHYRELLRYCVLDGRFRRSMHHAMRACRLARPSQLPSLVPYLAALASGPFGVKLMASVRKQVKWMRK